MDAIGNKILFTPWQLYRPGASYYPGPELPPVCPNIEDQPGLLKESNPSWNVPVFMTAFARNTQVNLKRSDFPDSDGWLARSLSCYHVIDNKDNELERERYFWRTLVYPRWYPASEILLMHPLWVLKLYYSLYQVIPPNEEGTGGVQPHASTQGMRYDALSPWQAMGGRYHGRQDAITQIWPDYISQDELQQYWLMMRLYHLRPELQFLTRADGARVKGLIPPYEFITRALNHQDNHWEELWMEQIVPGIIGAAAGGAGTVFSVLMLANSIPNMLEQLEAISDAKEQIQELKEGVNAISQYSQNLRQTRNEREQKLMAQLHLETYLRRDGIFAVYGRYPETGVEGYMPAGRVEGGIVWTVPLDGSLGRPMEDYMEDVFSRPFPNLPQVNEWTRDRPTQTITNDPGTDNYFWAVKQPRDGCRRHAIMPNYMAPRGLSPTWGHIGGTGGRISPPPKGWLGVYGTGAFRQINGRPQGISETTMMIFPDGTLEDKGAFESKCTENFEAANYEFFYVPVNEPPEPLPPGSMDTPLQPVDIFTGDGLPLVQTDQMQPGQAANKKVDIKSEYLIALALALLIDF